MRSDIIPADSDQRIATQRNNINQPSHKPNLIDQISIKLNQFFSKGWNVVRSVFFIICVSYGFFVLSSASSSLAEGESLTFSILLREIRQQFKFIQDNFPILNTVFTKFSNLISVRYTNFLLFLTSMISTVLLLFCFCS